MTHEEAINAIQGILAQVNGVSGVTNNLHCTIHDVEMKAKISKAGKPYTAHFEKLPDDTWRTCFGKGWKE